MNGFRSGADKQPLENEGELAIQPRGQIVHRCEHLLLEARLIRFEQTAPED